MKWLKRLREKFIGAYNRYSMSRSLIGRTTFLFMSLLVINYRSLRAIVGIFSPRHRSSWMDSPVQGMGYFGLKISTNRFNILFRWINHRSGAILKFRELRHTDKMNFVGRVIGAVDQKVLRNLVAWQYQIIAQNPEIPPHGKYNMNIILSGSIKGDPQVIDLLTAAFLSERVGNVNLYWDDETLNASVPLTMSIAERNRRADGLGEFNLSQPEPGLIKELELKGFQSSFSLLLDSRKKVNDFLKTTAPGEMGISISLPENESGIVLIESIKEWMAVFTKIREAFPFVSFYLLNRYFDWSQYQWPYFVKPIRNLGFTFLDAVVTAQMTDAYFGVFDFFGLAAFEKNIPGVYMPLDPDIYENEPRNQKAEADAESLMLQCMEILEQELAVEFLMRLIKELRSPKTLQPLYGSGDFQISNAA